MSAIILPLDISRIATGGTAVVATQGPMLTAVITNPAGPVDQQLPDPEPLYIDLTTTAGLVETVTCFPLVPGQSFTVPQDFAGSISVNAASDGHAFAGYVLQWKPVSDFVALIGEGETGKPFPPEGPGVLREVIPSYLYQQYSDDEDLQAFVAAFNSMANQYAKWFAYLNPADYTQAHITSPLLDWVVAGLYGMVRPALPSGITRTIGPFNTYAFNTWQLNLLRTIPPSDLQDVSDDVFKRILTWHLYKGDGDVFSLRWLKRRVERFLTGENGTGGVTDQTYDVSVTFGVGNDVNINLQGTRRRFSGGGLFNTFALNTTVFNALPSGDVIHIPVNPLAPIFKAAVDAGVLELPFQYHFIVNVRE